MRCSTLKCKHYQIVSQEVLLLLHVTFLLVLGMQPSEKREAIGYIQILFHWKKVDVGIQTQESCECCPPKASGRRWESIGTIVSVNRNSKGANFMTFLIVWPQLWYSSFIEFHSGLIWWMASGQRSSNMFFPAQVHRLMYLPKH